MPFSLDHVVFFGRTWNESIGMYALDEACLQTLRILDCPGGPDGLVSEGLARGLDITAVDPQYASTAEALEQRGRSEINQTVDAWLADPETGDNHGGRAEDSEAQSRMARMRTFKQLKIEALESFIKAFRRHPDRYVTGKLPDLPFDNDSFDLVLSGHLLFAYASKDRGGLMHDETFDLDFHIAAVRELIRVGHEVRLFPTYAFFGPRRRHDYIAPVLDAIRADGHTVDFIPAQWVQDTYSEFNDTLRIRKGSG